MPELPEVETVKRGLIPELSERVIQKVVIRQYQLRWLIPKSFAKDITGQTIRHLSRRGKYLLIYLDTGALIIHLGMSGCLKVLDLNTPVLKHDHVDIVLNHHKVLRYHDPRRFGAILFTKDCPLQHSLLSSLGLEPLDDNFSGVYLKQKIQNRKAPIKSVIMNHHIVTGVGNIYATEALFLAKIHPEKPACSLTNAQCKQLVIAIQQVLKSAIEKGGTTVKDFVNSEGKPGYFVQELCVYGRNGLSCKQCSAHIQTVRIGQRCSAFCGNCQRL